MIVEKQIFPIPQGTAYLDTAASLGSRNLTLTPDGSFIGIMRACHPWGRVGNFGDTGSK